MNLLLASFVLSVIGSFMAIIASKLRNFSRIVACTFGVVAALTAIAAGVAGIVEAPMTVVLSTPFVFGEFSILLNPLSGLMLVVINGLALLAWIYGFSYFTEYREKGIGAIGMFMNLFVVSMNLVVTIDNVFWFLVFFELMSISSYFLVIIDQDRTSTKGGLMYLLMAHVGFLLIMVAFLIMANSTGSFDFESFRNNAFAKPVASTVFVLAFLGFGCKAGMFPFHSWLPQAHPAAPSNVSALMSGGMIKIGIFGIIKVAFDLLSVSGNELWWGILVLVLGAASSVLGVIYALSEHDIKRLLAYHSVENIGIILLGVGTALIGASMQNQMLVALGLLAGLFHLFNHAVFKALLFFGAGAVLYATETRDMEKMGGLAKAMPVTSICFLVGSLAISAIPPLNGFVSEWFTYQAMFNAASAGDHAIQVVMAFAVVALAITGALAVTCFVKACGVTFLGKPRSEHAAKAKEVPLCMRVAMITLALVCVALGLGAPWATTVFVTIADSVANGATAATTAPVVGIELVNPVLGTVISTPLVAVLLIAAVVAVIGVVSLLRSGGVDLKREPWACGYQPDAHMPMIATSFGANIKMFLRPPYAVRTFLSEGSARFRQLLQRRSQTLLLLEGAKPVAEREPVDVPSGFIGWLGIQAKRLEAGNYRVYIVYIIVALVAFLVLSVVGSR
jgi:hydrogenase-4 component B